MRALRLLALAAALVVPAAAAHAQFGVYVGPTVRYAAPVYGPAYYPGPHWDHRIYSRPYYGSAWVARPRYGFHRDWRGYHGYRGRW